MVIRLSSENQNFTGDKYAKETKNIINNIAIFGYGCSDYNLCKKSVL